MKFSKGGAGLCRDNGSIQSIFDKKKPRPPPGQIGLISLASRSRMKRRKSGRAGTIDIDGEM